MATVIIRRLLQLVPVILLATALVFVLVRLAPGDPVQQPWGAWLARSGARRRVAAKMGLDKPIPVQYAIWLRNAVTGDLGISVKSNDQFLDLIIPKLVATLELIVAALVIAITIALSAGYAAAVRAGTWVDQVARAFVVTGLAIPSYWLA